MYRFCKVKHTAVKKKIASLSATTVRDQWRSGGASDAQLAVSRTLNHMIRANSLLELACLLSLSHEIWLDNYCAGWAKLNGAYCGHTMRKQGSCLEKEIMQRTVPGARRRGRPRTAWMDNTRRGQDSPWKSHQNDRGQGQMEKVRPWCGQPSDRGRLKNRTHFTSL